MAVSATFKQPCPSCQAMVTIKEAQVGRKVECHKCKDKFVAEEPIQKKTGVKKDSGMTRKNTSLQKKVDTRVTAKAPAPGKNGKSGKKAPVDDDELEEVDIDEEDDDRPQTKSKGKPGPNGKSKPDTNITAKGKPPTGKSKRPVAEDEEDVEADEDEKPGKKKKKAGGSNKMTIGLGLAGVGVVVLCVAAYFVLRGPSTPTPPVKPPDPGLAKNNNVAPPPAVEKKPDPPPDGKPPVKPPVVVKPPDPIAGALTDAEIAKLSNLLPNDAEHVFHVNFKELFSPTSALRDAAFQSPGALIDAEIRNKIGFSPLLIDDVMRAERHTRPWSYTVLHFKEVVAEEDVAAALKLAAVGAPIDGKVYYRLGEPNPWFDSLARFSFGIPNQFTQFSNSASDRPAFIHFYNSQTMIVADEEPLVQLLKAKRQFPLLTPRGGAQPPPEVKPAGGFGGDKRYFVPPTGRTPEFVSALANDQGVVQPPVGGGGGDGAIKFDNTTWEGKENKDGKIQFKFADAGAVTVDSMKSNLTGAPGQWKAKGRNGLEITFMTTPGLSYEVTVDAAGKMTGMGKDMTGMWPVELEKPGGTPTPTPTPTPIPTNREDMFLTIKPSLKAIMDRMETRVPGAKILFSSATDMDASRVTTNLPELRDRIVRRPRQFWDVTLMIAESTPRIRMLGTTLVQRDNARFQYRNELTCGLEIDAKYIHQELSERTANQIARFIMKLVGHEIRVPQGPEVTAIGAQPPDDKKLGDATASQITLKQEANTVDFTLDLVLDDGARTQIQGVTSLTAAALRVEMEAAAAVSMRHALAWAARTMGEKGLSDREVPEGKLPPGAFKRLDAPLRPDREPKNRISWMAALLPYMGHGNLYKTMQFDQSWRDPGNWRAGRTVIPQFLDPTYPDASRYVAFSALPVDFGATHYVGIAGVGPDAGAYNRRDPAVGHKRGVLGYDESATLDEVRLARGTSNSILMIQIPHDGITGVSPWIAGGGATLRGVEEKNSIAPFVLTTDKNGKPIHHQKKRGTYAVMTDGTVRFIGASVSDDVFKAMCTIGGNVPQDFDPPTNPNTPAIPPPTSRKPAGKTTGDSKSEKQPAEKTPAPAVAPKDGQPKKTSLLAPAADEPSRARKEAGDIASLRARLGRLSPAGRLNCRA